MLKNDTSHDDVIVVPIVGELQKGIRVWRNHTGFVYIVFRSAMADG
jgi:hypothetical protein